VSELGVRLRLGRRQIGHVRDVRTGDERVVAGAFENERAGAGGLRLVERLLDRFEGVDGHRVELFWSIDGERRHAAFVDVEMERFPSHTR